MPCCRHVIAIISSPCRHHSFHRIVVVTSLPCAHVAAELAHASPNAFVLCVIPMCRTLPYTKLHPANHATPSNPTGVVAHAHVNCPHHVRQLILPSHPYYERVVARVTAAYAHLAACSPASATTRPMSPHLGHTPAVHRVRHPSPSSFVSSSTESGHHLPHFVRCARRAVLATPVNSSPRQHACKHHLSALSPVLTFFISPDRQSAGSTSSSSPPVPAARQSRCPPSPFQPPPVSFFPI